LGRTIRSPSKTYGRRFFPCSPRFSASSVLRFERLNTEGAEKTGATENDRTNLILCIHDDEGDLAGLITAVGPGVVGAALNDDVARLQVNVGIVQEHVDLAG
jgi:hypothetical protein